MTSVYIDVVSNLWELQHQMHKTRSISPPIDGVCTRVIDQSRTIVREFRYLKLIEEVVLHMSIKFGVTIQEIASQVKGEEFQKLNMELPGIVEVPRSRFISWAKFQKQASKILDALADLNAKIDLLKTEIREVCKNSLAQPFQYHSPMANFSDWQEFVSSMSSCLRELEDKCSSDDRRNKALDFHNHLRSIQGFLDSLPDIPRAQDLSILVANVAVHAAFVSCQWWASQFDPNMEDDVIIALSDLQRKINFALPDLLDQMLRLLKALKETNHSNSNSKAMHFVQYILRFNWRFEKISGKPVLLAENLLSVLVKEIGSLTTSVLPFIADEDAVDEQSFLLDFNLLVSEIEESFSCSLPVNGSLLLNLLAKVWLMKIEAFIVEQLTACDDLLLSEKKQIDAVNEGVQLIKELPEEHSENVNQILALMEVAAKLVASLHHSFCANDITRDMVRTVLFLLRLKILHLKLDRKLYDKNGSLMLAVKDRLQFFLEVLKFLLNCFDGFINQKGGIVKEGLLAAARIEAMARGLISLYHSLLNQNITEESIENMNLMLSDLQDELKFIMAKLREIYLPRSNFPKTNALGFFDALLIKLRELLLNYKADFFVSVKQHIEEILADLEFFRYCLGDIPELEGKEIQELGNLGGHVINVAYEAEYLVDSIVASDKSEFQYLIWLYDLVLNIRNLKMQVTKVNEGKTDEVKVRNVLRISRHVVSRTSTPKINDDVLSLNDQQELIIDRLVGGFPQRDIVSIVGMPGIGKTTLAKKVYSSRRIDHHFHIRAWCCVTEVYRKKELLLEILSQITVLTDNICGMSGEDLEFKLRQLLLKKKYLIVMDDVWSTEAWDDLQTSFPNDENGSRILMTSRLNHVALEAKAHHSDPHRLRLLSVAESWDLLQMRIFRGEHCPKELIKVGQEIAESCKGLPLAIVATAGLLQRTDRQHSQWKEIAKNLSSRIVDDPEEQCRDILELSYKVLPDYLKACFLYFGAFLEEQEIPVKKLIQLWIAEGFVQKTELKSLEDLAEDYLDDLIGRSLVIFAKPRSGGGNQNMSCP